MGRIRLGAFTSFFVSVMGGVVAAKTPLIFFVAKELTISIDDLVRILVFGFVLPLIFGGPVIVTGLLVFVVPVTSYCTEHRTRRWFGFLLVCWAALAGGMMMAVPIRNGDYYWSVLLGAQCGGISALCWWLTSRERWTDIARRKSATSSPESESAHPPASRPAARSET